MNAIKIEGLTKRYRDVLAVDSLFLDIEAGELFSLLGVNGAGKTTTIKMLSCLTAPTSGDAYLLGKSIRQDTAAVKSLIAVSPQETAVAAGLSVRENLELMCGVHGFSKDKRAEKIRELTALLGLESVIARSDLWDVIRALKGKVTIILTTHYMEEAEALSDRIGIMKDGKLLLCDTAENIKAAAGVDDFEQAFIRIVKGDAQ